MTDPFTPPSPVSRITFEHTGQSNFAVKIYDQDGDYDLLVNEIGNYSGSRPLLSDKGSFILRLMQMDLGQRLLSQLLLTKMLLMVSKGSAIM